jgi:deazaflavin-dependent oxidoreductase (nitroreductase family)
MAKSYRLTPPRRVANALMRLLLRLGLAPRATVLLTVPGRRSGKPRSTPVTLVEEDGQRWLVSPFGPVGWLHNARAGGQVALTRGRPSETVRMEELSPKAAAPILKAYVERVPVTGPISTSPRTRRSPPSRPSPPGIPSSGSSQIRLSPDLPQRVGAANPSHPLG